MEQHNKTYSEYPIAGGFSRETHPPSRPGFTLTMLEYVQTIPTFWNTMTEFIKKNPQYVATDNAMDFLSNDGGRSYSLCHCKCGCFPMAPEAPFLACCLMIYNNIQFGVILKSPT